MKIQACLLVAVIILCVDPSTSWSQAHPVRAGSSLYHDFCSVCHGDKGNGDSHARQGLKPPPKDFTQAGEAQRLSRDRMFSTIKNGKPGTAMVAWGSRLNDDEVFAIIDYIRSEFMQPEKAPQTSIGHEIYRESCSVCHGDDGAGAQWAGSSLNPPPRDFTAVKTRQTLTRAGIVQAVTNGRPGTAMTSFKRQLTDEDINAVADFINTTFLLNPK